MLGAGPSATVSGGAPSGRPAKDISEISREGTEIDKAIRKAARLAWLAHKREDLPIPIWKDGKTVWIPPEEIQVPDEEAG